MGINKSLTVEQVAEELGVCRATIWNYIKAGKIKSFSFGNRRRIREVDVADYIERHTHQPVEEAF